MQWAALPGCRSTIRGRAAYPDLLRYDRPAAAFGICGQHRHREDAIVWKYRTANKLATVRWGLTKEKINGAVAHFEEKAYPKCLSWENRYKELQDSKGERDRTGFPDRLHGRLRRSDNPALAGDGGRVLEDVREGILNN